MSEYGPAFFIKRKDGNDISEKEQKELLKLTTKIARTLKIKDEDGKLVEPEFYDYDDYETKSVSFVMFYDFIWGQMPEDMQNDTEQADQEKILKIAPEINKVFPKTYEYQSYYVEV